MKATEIEIIHEVSSIDEEIIQTVYLETDVRLYVKRRGIATGSDGKNYYPILSCDVNDDCRLVGWSSEIDREMMI